MDEWVSSSNEALEISLVQPAPTGLRTIASFHPQFTYPIFGNEETIFGYQDLKILLRYHASDMRPNLQVTYGKKFKPVGENEPTDITGILQEFLPAVAFQKPSEFEAAIQTPADSFHPPGTRIRELQTGDGRYEIWKSSLDDPAVQQLVHRIQIFVTIFIEGGSFIPTDGPDASTDRWTVFFLFRTRQCPGSADAYEYEFAGYSTVYRFLLPVGLATPPRATSPATETATKMAEFELDDKPGFSLATLPCRSRLSQFVILPPFQGKGNASRLYRAIFEEYLREPQTLEMTVEDPNEAFDDVRDLADLRYLASLPAFDATARIHTAVAIPRTGPAPKNIVDAAALERLRRETKIAPRQFYRLVEMHLMHKLAPSVRPNLDEAEDGKGKAPAATKEQEHEYKLWRLLVKQRLYRHNKEILGQLERSQRIEKLEETLRSVELEYARILSLYEGRTKLQEKEEAGKATGPTTKRKLMEDDAEDDGYGSSSSKKMRTET